MKAPWLVLLTAVPLAALVARDVFDAGPADRGAALAGAASASPAAALAGKIRAAAKADNRVAVAVLETDSTPAASLPGLDALSDESPLAPLRRSWPPWSSAQATAREILALAPEQSPSDAARAQAAKHQWEALREKLQSAKLPQSAPLVALADRRIEDLAQQLARLEALSQAIGAAGPVKGAFAAGEFELCITRSRQWLAQYAGTADASLVEEVKSLGRRAEFYVEAERLRGELKTAGALPRQEAAVVAFLDRFPSATPLAEPEQAMLANCRSFLENLRAARAVEERARAAEEAVRRLLASPPPEFEERVARAAEIAESHPEPAVKTALRSGLARWLEEALPEKRFQEHLGLQEAQTKDGRLLRGFFREISLPDGSKGYKRYESFEEYQSPTADVGTWWSRDMAAPPAAALPRRLVDRYHAARKSLLEQPGDRRQWEALSALCAELESEWNTYRSKPGASQERLSFEAEATLARKVLSTTLLRDLNRTR